MDDINVLDSPARASSRLIRTSGLERRADGSAAENIQPLSDQAHPLHNMLSRYPHCPSGEVVSSTGRTYAI